MFFTLNSWQLALLLLLFVAFDLDRPARGFITVPDAPLVAVRAGIELPPAAGAPG